MIDIKKYIASTLTALCSNVNNGYPNHWEHMPAIAYIEEANDDAGFVGEDTVYVRYRIDVWDTKSVTDLSKKIIDAFKAQGFTCCKCMDIDEISVYKHKLIRIEARVDEYLHVYSPR